MPTSLTRPLRTDTYGTLAFVERSLRRLTMLAALTLFCASAVIAQRNGDCLARIGLQSIELTSSVGNVAAACGDSHIRT